MRGVARVEVPIQWRCFELVELIFRYNSQLAERTEQALVLQCYQDITLRTSGQGFISSRLEPLRHFSKQAPRTRAHSLT